MRIHTLAASLLALAAMFSAGAAQAAACTSTTVLHAATDGVDTSDGLAWANAKTLQGALAAANGNTTAGQCYEIRVKQGVYKPVVPVNPASVTDVERLTSFAITRPLQLKGGYTGNTSVPNERVLNARNTVLSGDIDNNDTIDGNGITAVARFDDSGVAQAGNQLNGSNSYHVLTVGGTTTTTTTSVGGPYTANATDASFTLVEGFSVTGGRANGSFPHFYGGGLYCNGRSTGSVCSPSISNATFSGNSASDSGGAIYNEGAYGTSSPTISNATFSGNSASRNGGAIYNYGYSGTSSPTISNATFSGNSANFGGAIYNNCIYGTSSSTISNATFSGNSANFGGAIFNDGYYGTSSPTISNATFSGNKAGNNGGAIYNYGLYGTSSPTISNATFSGNSASNHGGAIYNDGYYGTSSPTITASILWGNTLLTGGGGAGPQIYNNSATPTVQWSIVQGGWTGAGSNNQDADPVLGPLQDNGGPTHTMVPGAGRAASDAVACNVSGTTVTADQRGVARPQGPTCDIGAVERRTSTNALAITFAGTGAGSVTGGLGACASTSNSCSTAYDTEGAPLTVTLSATPTAGSTFTGWGGACSGTAPCVVTMDAARSVTASFALNTYTVTGTAFPIEGGSVSCTPNPVSHGSTATCTATPNVGYYLLPTWATACSSSGQEGNSFTTGPVTADCTVMAQFGLLNYAVTVTANPAAGGSVGCTPNPVNHGSTATCTPTAQPGYMFTGWGGDCSGAAATCSLANVTANKAVSASFALNTYTVTASAVPIEGGSVSCADSSVAHGSGTTCTATTQAGFTLGGFTGCDSVSGNVCNLSNVTAARSVVANFAAVTSFSGTTVPSAGGTPGPASASFTGGGATCRFDTSASTAFVAAPATLPAGQTMPHGMLQFKLVGCNDTPVTMSITWPAAVQGLSKWGKATAGAAPSHFAPNGLNVIGNVTTFTVQDGQKGDDDWAVNGEIVDPVGGTVPVVAAAINPTPVPTLGQWALVLLSLMAAALGMGTLRRRGLDNS